MFILKFKVMKTNVIISAAVVIAAFLFNSCETTELESLTMGGETTLKSAVSANNDVTPVDEDGDGICDISGEPIGTYDGEGQGNKGKNRGAGIGNAIDEDGDGLCDITGEPVGTGVGVQDGTGRGEKGQGQGNKGENKGDGTGNFVDEDGDGLCDITGEPVGEGNEGNYIDEDGDGLCDLTGEPVGTGVGEKDGTGLGGNGNGKGNGRN